MERRHRKLRQLLGHRLRERLPPRGRLGLPGLRCQHAGLLVCYGRGHHHLQQRDRPLCRLQAAARGRLSRQRRLRERQLRYGARWHRQRPLRPGRHELHPRRHLSAGFAPDRGGPEYCIVGHRCRGDSAHRHHHPPLLHGPHRGDPGRVAQPGLGGRRKHDPRERLYELELGGGLRQRPLRRREPDPLLHGAPAVERCPE